MDVEKARQVAIAAAFDGAAEELGIGMGSLDVWKRELLARIVVEFAPKYGADSDALQSLSAARFRALAALERSPAARG
jgi:hypothetical protein